MIGGLSLLPLQLITCYKVPHNREHTGRGTVFSDAVIEFVEDVVHTIQKSATGL